MTHSNISYAQSDDPIRKFDLYPSPSAHVAPLICFVHGGAWRSEDKAHHADLAKCLATSTHCPVAVPNYRLTPPDNTDPALHHPAHAADILSFLEFMCAWDASPVPFDPQRLILIGHSCSAHMIAAIVLDSDEATPSLAPTSALRKAVRGIVVSEGIYDLDALLVKFPTYRAWFIAEAFGDLPSYAPYSVLNYPLRPNTDEDGNNTENKTSWLLVHSKGDTLVDIGQTEAMYAHLSTLYPSPSHVAINTGDLIEEHNAILKTERYVQIVHEFAATVLDLPSAAQ